MEAVFVTCLEVFDGVTLRRGTLHIVYGRCEGKALFRLRWVHKLAGTLFLVALILGELGAGNDQIRQISRELSGDNLSVGVKDIVVFVPFDHGANDLRIGDPVAHDLRRREVVVIHPYTVDVDSAAV